MSVIDNYSKKKWSVPIYGSNNLIILCYSLNIALTQL